MDINQIRAEIPYPKDIVFMNSAGSSLVPSEVADAITRYLEEERRWGGYYVEEKYADKIADFYKDAAKLIGGKEHNMAFAHDATDAYAKVLSSIPWQVGDMILTTNDDYASNQIQFLSLRKRYGINVLRGDNLANGDLDLAHFEEIISKSRPRLTAVTHVPTNSGKVQDVAAVGAMCAEVGGLYLVDACQTVGQLPIDVNEIKCDFLTTTGRKFLRGPRGTGFMYVSDNALNEGYAPLMIDGHGAVWSDDFTYEMKASAKRFEGWERPYAMMMGLGVAIRYANRLGSRNIELANQKLMDRLRNNLKSLAGVRLYDEGTHTCNILTFRKQGNSLEEVSKSLSFHHVIHSVSSRQWGIIDFAKKGIDGAVRLSPHYFNTLREMDVVAEVVENI